jgi:hypothetical protein
MILHVPSSVGHETFSPILIRNTEGLYYFFFPAADVAGVTSFDDHIALIYCAKLTYMYSFLFRNGHF